MTIVIPAAGRGKRFGTVKPKCLAKIDGETIIGRMLRQIKEVVPGAEVRVVVGYRGAQVAREVLSVSPHAHVYTNDAWKTTSVSTSVAIGCSGVLGHVVVIDGDVVVRGELHFLANELNRPTRSYVCITIPKSEEPMYVRRGANGACCEFTRQETLFEWAGICAADARWFGGVGFICSDIPLPQPVLYVDSWDIDTQKDLKGASKWIKR
jgi:choline kinase